jgi:hypothetical protein
MADNKPKVSLMDLEDLNKQESSGPSQATTPSVETEEEDDVKISRIRKFGEEGGVVSGKQNYRDLVNNCFHRSPNARSRGTRYSEWTRLIH